MYQTLQQTIIANNRGSKFVCFKGLSNKDMMI